LREVGGEPAGDYIPFRGIDDTRELACQIRDQFLLPGLRLRLCMPGHPAARGAGEPWPDFRI
jgi:hypothetical protein